MIALELKDRIARILIDRPSEGNAFTGDMVRRLRDALTGVAGAADIVTLTGAGVDFTVGRDRNEPRTGAPFDAFSAISELNEAIAAYPGVFVTVARGRVHGLGVGLILRSDIAFASEDATFALDEVKHGIPPMFIMERILDHLPAKGAMDIILSGREFPATEALQMGLLSRVVPAQQLESAANLFVDALSRSNREVVLACKRYLRATSSMPAESRAAFALVEQTRFAQRKH
jgi:enoyl-CoA hydratase/carnithine racemase